MVNWIVELSLKHRVLVIGLAVALGAWGWWAATATPIDAIPDLSDNQVIVFTDWAGHSAQEVEDQVSYPLTVNLRGLAGVRVVRSQSAFGFSMIYVVFEDNVDQYFARTRVLERLSLVSTQMPEGAVPTLGPDATGVGHVFWYTVESRPPFAARSPHPAGLVHPLSAECRARRRRGRVGRRSRAAVPDRHRSRTGCAPTTCRLPVVVEAVRSSNENVGGNVLEANGTWSIVRGVGLIESIGDLEQIVIAAPGGVPVYVRQVAKCTSATRSGSPRSSRDATKRVGGVVVDAQRRERAAGHRRGQAADQPDCARPAARRAHRAVLRPLDAHLAGGRYASPRAPRGNRPGDAGRRRSSCCISDRS